MNERTLDGKPISAGISGFTTYSTERIAAPLTPPPALSPGDFLEQISALQKALGKQEIEHALQLLFTHVHDTNNPHHTDLDQFTMQVVDVLYKEYRAQGGKGTQEFYIQCLFKTLRIATLEEMKTGTDTGLLISVRGAKLFIADHENDPNAHAAIFDALMPGTPLLADPTYAVHSIFGISDDLFTYLEKSYDQTTLDIRPYTFVGADGYLHTCSSASGIPVDYQYGEPLIPCFGKRTNSISASNNFQLRSPANVTLRTNAGQAPDRTATATTVVANHDDAVCAHTFAYKDIELPFDTPKTFSVFAKAENCRYLSISWKDMTNSVVMVRCIYDLQTGDHLLMNHMDRYSAEIFPLANGWFRCSFSMYHPIGQKTDIILTFFKEKKNSTDATAFQFLGTGEVCGYLWGSQLEDGPNASPYIPTTGKPATRFPVQIGATLPEEMTLADAATFAMTFLNPKRNLKKTSIRPLLTILDEHGLVALTSRFTSTGTLDLGRYTTLTVGDLSIPAMVYQDVFDPSTDTYGYLSHGIDKKSVVSAYQKNVVFRSTAPNDWSRGKMMYLGNDGAGNFLEGYIRSLVLYGVGITVEQAKFLNGEEIYG